MAIDRGLRKRITIGWNSPNLTATPNPLNIVGIDAGHVHVIWQPASSSGVNLTGVSITGPGLGPVKATTLGTKNYKWTDPMTTIGTYSCVVSATIDGVTGARTLDPQIINKSQ